MYLSCSANCKRKGCVHSTPLASKVHGSINGLENSSSPEYSKVQHLLEITVGLFSVGVGLFFVTGGLGKSPPPTKKSPTPTEKSPTLTVKSPTYKKSSSNQKRILLQRKKSYSSRKKSYSVGKKSYSKSNDKVQGTINQARYVFAQFWSVSRAIRGRTILLVLSH